jgi:hypothetical protein
MERIITTTGPNYFREFLRLSKGFLDFSKVEREIIVNILLCNKKVIDTEVRSRVRSKMNIKENNLNNHIMRLKKKGALLEYENGLTIHPTITDALKDREIVLKFNIVESVNRD